jgi:uncharacterized RDD family membrane protein YckC
MYCTQCGSQNPDEAKFCFNCGKQLGGEVLPATPGTPAMPEYAGFWRRFVAYIIDRLILGVPSAILVALFIVPSIVGLVAGGCVSCCSPENFPLAIFPFIVGWIWLIALIVVGHLLYFAWFESSKYQANPGKMLLGIIVTDLEGQRVSFYRSLGRNAGKVISHLALNIGFILAGLTPRKQALHDMLADCLVVMKTRV